MRQDFRPPSTFAEGQYTTHLFLKIIFFVILIKIIMQFCINYRIGINNDIWTEIIGLEMKDTIQLWFAIRI